MRQMRAERAALVLRDTQRTVCYQQRAVTGHACHAFEKLRHIRQHSVVRGAIKQIGHMGDIVPIGYEIRMDHLILQNLRTAALHIRRKMAKHLLLKKGKRLQWFGKKSISPCRFAQSAPIVIGADPQNSRYPRRGLMRLGDQFQP